MEDIVALLLERSRIRKQIPTRKSVLDNRPDRLCSLLEDAANEISELRDKVSNLEDIIESRDKW